MVVNVHSCEAWLARRLDREALIASYRPILAWSEAFVSYGSERDRRLQSRSWDTSQLQSHGRDTSQLQSRGRDTSRLQSRGRDTIKPTPVTRGRDTRWLHSRLRGQSTRDKAPFMTSALLQLRAPLHSLNPRENLSPPPLVLRSISKVWSWMGESVSVGVRVGRWKRDDMPLM